MTDERYRFIQFGQLLIGKGLTINHRRISFERVQIYLDDTGLLAHYHI